MYNINAMIETYNFDTLNGAEMQTVFMYTPPMFADNRGYFSEVLKTIIPSKHLDDNIDTDIDEKFSWFKNQRWIKQINRSSSGSKVVRGLHAQSGAWCQAKLVEALTDVIYDVIIDARPQSTSFGANAVVRLDPALQNKLFIPAGFLHGFIVPESKNGAIFNYYCSNIYKKDAEITINPVNIIPKIVNEAKTRMESSENAEQILPNFAPLFNLFTDDKLESLVFSDKDKNGRNLEEWLKEVREEYYTYGVSWHS